MEFPEIAKLAPGELARVKAAAKALEEDEKAPKELTVRVLLHLHREYPKHVTVGKDKEGNAITKIANSAEEEAALSAPAAEPAAAEEVV